MTAVFSNERLTTDNPFYEEPEPKTFYHPTLPKKLSKKEKSISLSPHRGQQIKQSTRPGPSNRDDGKRKVLSPGERGFLSGSNTMLAKELPTHDTPSPGPGDTSSKFDESWPTSERPSTIESPADARNISSSSATTPQGSALSQAVQDGRRESTETVSEQRPDSTLARLIERFRYGAPQSREERIKETSSATPQDFWWLKPSSSPPSHPSSSTRPARQPPPSMGTTPVRRGMGVAHGRGRGGRRGVGRGVFGTSRSHLSGTSAYSRSTSVVSALSSSSSTASSVKLPSSVTDRDTDELQRRADKLLELSENTLLSEPLVSSDGLGSFSTSTPTPSDDITPPRREALPSRVQDKENIPRPALFPSSLTHTARPLRPDEDILQQWRMRRRLDLAKEGAVGRGSSQVADRLLRHAQPEQAGNQRVAVADKGDVDSKLAEFRQGLHQQRLLTGAKSASRTRPPDSGREPSTAHTATDPIPQSTATQTRRTAPSLDHDQSMEDGVSYKETPSVRSQRLQADHADQESVSRDHLIASPNVESVSNRRNLRGGMVDVPPHLHMSCDILPCGERGPHEHTREDVKQRLGGMGYDGIGGGCDRESVVGGKGGRIGLGRRRDDTRDSRDDQRRSATGQGIGEGQMRKGAQDHIQPNKPPYHQEAKEMGTSLSGHNASQSRLMESKSGGIGVERGLDSARSFQDIDEWERVDDQISNRLVPAASGISKNVISFEQADAQTGALQIRSTSNTHRGSTDTAVAASASQPPTTREGGASETLLPAGVEVATGRMGESVDTETRDGDRDHVGEAESARRQLQFDSSSPIRGAIGQVISSRMFASPSGQRSPASSVRSSVVSQRTPPFTPPREGERTTTVHRMDSPDAVDEPPESARSSDSEEFREDEMLQVLRSRREACVRQLNQLDRLLMLAGTD